ncbi:MAG: sulfatase [Planctomycetota bacterium]
MPHSVVSRPSPGSFGVRCGLAVGIFEIVQNLPLPRPVRGNPLLLPLFFLVPLAFDGMLGLLLGWGGAWVAKRLRALRGARAGLPAAGALAALAWMGLRNRPEIRENLLPSIGALTAGLVFVSLRRLDSRVAGRMLVGFFLLLFATAAGFSFRWLGTEKAPYLGEGPAGPAPAGANNVVLITWDTVRADVLPLYGGTGLETPHLDAFAARSVVFDQMTAEASITAPSHATLLTGVVPPSHGVHTNAVQAIAPDVPRVPGAFREAGWDTAAFVASEVLWRKAGFEKGFRLYDDRLQNDHFRLFVKSLSRHFSLMRFWFFRKLRSLDESDPQIPGSKVLERAEGFLKREKRPFFLWVHFYDAHRPYDPKEPYLSRARSLAAGARPAAADPDRLGESMTLYRAEIMELDALLGRFLGDLETLDPGLEHTAILLTADHGECFGEHGLEKHSPSLLEATLHVPAILHLPGGRGAGRRIPDLVAHVDVEPTLLALAGLESLQGSQGVSLLDPARGTGPVPARTFFRRGFYMEAFAHNLIEYDKQGNKIRDDRKVGLRTPKWKYFAWTGGRDPRIRLYAMDQGEELDLSAVLPEERKTLEKILAQERSRIPVVASVLVEITAEEKQAFAELGYLGGTEDEEDP